MKKKIIFGFLCLLSLTNVNASEYKEPISSIVKDNTLYVDMEVPTNDEEFANVKDILNEQYKDLLQDNDTSSNQSLYLTDCSDDYSVCYVIFSGCAADGNECGDTPIPDVSIKWKENYGDLFNKVAPNGIFEVKAITPTNDIERSNYVYSHLLNLYPAGNVTGDLSNCDSSNTKCTLTIYEDDNGEEHEVSVKWQETNSETKKAIDSYIKQIESNRPTTNGGIITYELSDLNKINYLNHMKFESYPDHFLYMHQAIKYSPEAKMLLGNNNYDHLLIRKAVNDEAKIFLWGYGTFTLCHNGIAYGVIDNTLLNYKNVIYIPEDTENTKEAYIAAAKKRIDEYLGNTNSKIEVAGKRDEYKCLGDECYSFSFSKLGDESKMGDYYYNVTIGDVTEEFVIVRDSSKIETPSNDTKDINTNITVSSTSSEVPLDTIIKVQIVDTVSEVFNKINEVLKLEDKQEVQVYDIKLFSESSNKYITKLGNGEFKVSVPIKDSLKGKELVAYYVNDNNEKEVHEVTVVDGIAIFTTNHFSIYTIAEKEKNEKEPEDSINEQIPPTGDNIITYVAIGMIGLIGLGTGMVLIKKEN